VGSVQRGREGSPEGPVVETDAPSVGSQSMKKKEFIEIIGVLAITISAIVPFAILMLCGYDINISVKDRSKSK
jgi:hypothetical protein